MQRIANELRERGFDAIVTTVNKNGTDKEAISVKINDRLSKVLYEDTIDGLSINGIVDLINSRDAIEPDVDLMTDINFTLDNCYIGLQREFTDNIVCKDFNGYAQYIYVANYADDNEGMYSYKVNPNMLIGVTERELWERATENTNNSLSIKDMFGMAIATNEHMINGAGVITTPENIQKAKDYLRADNILVIPSSIHEVIFLKYDKDKDKVIVSNSFTGAVAEEDVDFIKNMIAEVNATEVNPEDILGYEPIIL